MLDMQSASVTPPRAILREEYRQPDWLVPDIALDFTLDPGLTRVRARLTLERIGRHDAPIRLDGEGLKLIEVSLDGEMLGTDRYRLEDDALVIPCDADKARLETLVEIAPQANSQLMGLYESGGILCTQCEAEGFRRITFFPDRPDVLTRYSVRMDADKAEYPVLLSNGDCVESGEGEGSRHWARWEDPWPKPSYLFALVAGDLVANRDKFVTRSGKSVDLAIWVREGDLAKTGHAMESLKKAMKWDEETYGREYDLDQFNIVAVADFNFGAMENKSLNIFNSRYVLADPDTATDGDYDAIAAVVAHEYFHNWSGNRVTCRDWFQLSLKEGFTVFRDQSFSADQGSPAVSRISDVRALRSAQFPEDAGPLAHPVRPDSYIEISNFYTATVYNKGAELIRMLHTLLGPEAFRKGADLYFERNDGQAVTCEDFVAAMEDASGRDLSRFRLWYSQAGTPQLSATIDHDAGSARATVRLEQSIEPTPGQVDKQPMAIPVKLALFGAHSGKRLGEEMLGLLDEPSEEIVIDGIAERPVLSINQAREALRRDIGAALAADWRAAYAGNSAERYEYSPEAKAKRRLGNTALSFIAASGAEDAPQMAFAQFEAADNMTDRQAALAVLANGDSPDRVAALAGFYERYRDNALVLDKWFAIQAISTRDDTAARVEELAGHPDFTLRNPNRLRSLVTSFGVNQRAFHTVSGRGYRFLAGIVLEADKINPQTAARMVTPLGRWRRLEEGRSSMMRTELERIARSEGLSKDLYEQVSKSLG
ncbi:MAG: aminopeptidase N [Sphingomonadales bacterium]|nr:aminopeptidase N [Sphingomonadales bacterium]